VVLGLLAVGSLPHAAFCEFVTDFSILDVGPQYGLVTDSIFESLGSQKLRTAELEFDTILVRQQNVARTLNWRFKNLFYADPVAGFVWKSMHVGIMGIQGGGKTGFATAVNLASAVDVPLG
jgi:hypothetical protein